ncbi:hypothetical protein DU478_14290 [Thalassococcus profundi]|jgi:hypothetical protein|uniref:Uncharacterized protein n=1 Tax=Thalassococcus profundi TaxID=2282382 RepID=A0A369TL99_9RHOB|nr:hypothetical protein [Thalassococcus profundi]RDD65602.1 hypothetical protein DU478_14290 [Thalassococcus profundi]
MALVGLMMGSVLGFFGAAAGWMIWDLSALTALAFYLFTSLAMGLAMVLFGAIRREDESADAAAVKAV